MLEDQHVFTMDEIDDIIMHRESMEFFEHRIIIRLVQSGALPPVVLTKP